MGNSIAIRVDGLGKQYSLSHQPRERYASLRDVIGDKVTSVFRKSSPSRRNTVGEFWALKNVNFETDEGEVLGIIGRNGAGKSTLLKVLSRITPPSVGRVVLKGRVASLLEVGTGFHPELTGRENIFLNGAILGMPRIEIQKKFDEIVAFAEVERFLDTPVKRYSSGMYVRLAFSVAAHLDPDILVVDEVLAVGDAQFQQKCLSKVESVCQNYGRTVLIVSHQMGVVARLCRRAIVLRNGEVQYDGPSGNAIEAYLSGATGATNTYVAPPSSGTSKPTWIAEAQTVDKSGEPETSFRHDEEFSINIRVECVQRHPGLRLGAGIQDRFENRVATWVYDLSRESRRSDAFTAHLTVSGGIIAPGRYDFVIALFVPGAAVIDHVQKVCSITIHDAGSELAEFEGVDYGCVIIPATWNITDYRQ